MATLAPHIEEDWDLRVAHARAAVAHAPSLDALAEVLNSPLFTVLPLADLVALPSFGGARPPQRGAFSWDGDRVLVMNPHAEGFLVERR
jgi:hypothetical protein